MAGLLDFLLNGQGGGVLPPFAQNFGAGDPGNAPVAAPDVSQAYAQAQQQPQQVAQAAPQYAQAQMPQMAQQMQAPQIGPPRMNGLAGLFAAMNPQAGQAYYQRMMMQQMYQAMTTPKSAGGLGLPPAQALVAMQSPDAMKLLGGVPIKLDPYETPGGYKGSQIYTANGPQTLYPTANGQAPADLSVRNVKPGEQIQDYSQAAGIGAGAVGPQVGGAPQGRVLGGNGTGMLSPDAIDFYARQVLAGDTSVYQNLGRNAQGAMILAAVRQRVAELAGQNNISPEENASRVAEFGGYKAAQTTLGNRLGNSTLAIKDTEYMAPQAIAAAQDVGTLFGGKYPPINAIMNAYEKNTGDPRIVKLGAALYGLTHVYARAVNPQGVASEHDLEHAQNILAPYLASGQLQAGIDQLKQEMMAMQKAVPAAQSEFRKNFTGSAGLAGKAAQQQSPSQSQSNAPDPFEGRTATNPKTGAKVIRRGGQWVPVQ